MTTFSQHIQIALLAGTKVKGEQFKDIIPLCVNYFLEGKYECVLESCEVATQILRNSTGDATTSFENFIKKNLEKVAENVGENCENRDVEILTLGASCLQLFVQNNWLGPPSEKCPLSFCHPQFKDQSKKVLTEVLEDFGLDGEETYSKSRHVAYLYLAKLIFLEGRSFCTHLQTWDWWLMRCLILQQSLLSERSPTLKATVLDIIEDVMKREPLMTDNHFRDIQILFHLEAGYACSDYYEFKKAGDLFNTARKIAGLDISLSGAMGKRTRFQQDEKPQLILKVTREEEQKELNCIFEFPSEVPKILPLDDDTVLNEINFTDEGETSTPQLSCVEYALVLGVMDSYRRSKAQERLSTEEVLTYLEYILHYSTNWCVTAKSLHLRSKLEKDSRRRVERSMMQLEVVSKMASDTTSSIGVSTRVPLFFASHLSPSWVIKRDYATVLMSLGLIGEALDVFESLEMWEDVISCYQRLKKTEKAESLIRERLAIKETPSLLCYLGDVTGKLEDYQKAWELSGQRNSRAIRCIGFIHFNLRDFVKAMDCFSKSLEINSLQVSLWFTYGCTAMTCEKYDVGAKAFRRCVNIDYDNFEAWSNLSTCFVRLKQKQKAYSVLQDALKCNYENWRLWENSLVIGIDVGEFGHVIKSYHRLIDLKQKWIDNEVLSILTRVVIEKIPDAEGRPADHLHGEVMKLFGRITSTVTGEGDIWSNYAKLTILKSEGREPDLDKALQHLQKAYRCFSQKVDWEKDAESCKKVGQEAVRLSETYLQCTEGKPQQTAIQLLSSAKLNLRGALVKVQKQHTDPVTKELSTQVGEICTQMDSTLQDIIARIEALKSE